MFDLYDSLKTFVISRRLRSIDDESGQTMVEYVLMVVLIALVVALAVPTVTTGITNAFNKVAGFLNK
jgi:Flp pilus assembly pilin Flp